MESSVKEISEMEAKEKVGALHLVGKAEAY